MTPNTCSTLAQIVPVLMLAVLLESRSINSQWRRYPRYLTLMAIAIVIGFVALIYLVVGVNNGGLGLDSQWIAWGASAIVALAAGTQFVLIGMSIEQENKAAAAVEAQAALDEETLAAEIAIRERLKLNWLGRRYLRLTQDGRHLRKLP
ncbi:hypothetical protein N8D74_02715 [Curtobacterium flaccumfaciens]|uniref:Uncharacterized protein n=1 Tax=Curtobacterium poinsettiae TaxID=159612 RepID=A0A9Q9P7N9_9MICO|nr:hypothetical protein [Curtobacterium flaccumfaciens]UXN25816.1 hypothetical protein N8D74_02715 [Curtobacterium flaccumfaciens]UYC80654.1 hypothetical protein OE229_16295 [Curtobacterium flaccumfaciens pv. poinsettiae]